MLELLNSLTMEAVIAILGSMVTIVLGAITLVKLLHSKTPPETPPPQESSLSDLRKEELDHLHARISSIKDLAAENKGDVRILTNLFKALEKQLAEHERRDIEDFKVMQKKIDKVMDIVIQILQDDKL